MNLIDKLVDESDDATIMIQGRDGKQHRVLNLTVGDLREVAATRDKNVLAARDEGMELRDVEWVRELNGLVRLAGSNYTVPLPSEKAGTIEDVLRRAITELEWPAEMNAPLEKATVGESLAQIDKSVENIRTLIKAIQL